MKKSLCLVIVSALVLAFSGCATQGTSARGPADFNPHGGPQHPDGGTGPGGGPVFNNHGGPGGNGGGFQNGHGPHGGPGSGFAPAHTDQPIVFHGGGPGHNGGPRLWQQNGWQHWNHPGFVDQNASFWNWNWGAISSVTCTGEDANGFSFPVTETDYIGAAAWQGAMNNIEDDAIDACYNLAPSEDPGVDPTTCYLQGCTSY